jgi:hypothetical protein
MGVVKILGFNEKPNNFSCREQGIPSMFTHSLIVMVKDTEFN